MTNEAPASRSFVFTVLLVCMAVSVGLHLNSFRVQHGEGDEWVYLTLAREMNWDLTHYTTRDDPKVREFPFAAYRGPVFIHPPLYPWALKVGLSLGYPLEFGLLCQVSVMLLLLVLVARWLLLQKVDWLGVTVVLLGFTFCPLLLASTTRLHLDGLAAAFCCGAVLLFLEALQWRSWRATIAAGVLTVLALNVRYSSLVLVPFLLLIQFVYLWQQSRLADTTDSPRPGWAAFRETAAGWRHWRVLVVVMALVLTLGLQHYYRLYLAYGTLLPGTIHAPDPARLNEFLRSVLGRTRLEAFIYLLLIFPFLVAFASGAYGRGLRDLARRPRLELTLLVAVPYFLGCCLWFQHILERYFALVMPFAYLSLPLLLSQCRRWERLVLYALLAVSLLSMLGSDYLTTIENPSAARIWPAILYFVEPLRPYCR